MSAPCFPPPDREDSAAGAASSTSAASAAGRDTIEATAERDAGSPGPAGRIAWVDATFGIAGDMLLAALLDAGADVEVVRAGVSAVLGDAVRLDVGETVRHGQRATSVEFVAVARDWPHRSWRTIRGLLSAADLPVRARDRASAVFQRLARAESRVHGVLEEEVTFHEVGAWDSISDVVGVCVALGDLGVERLRTSPVALGEGTVASAHGLLPVPGPAVLELLAGSGLNARALPVGARRGVLGASEAAEESIGELATPTGVALLVALADGPGDPPSSVFRVGVGAGRRDSAGWANVTRVVLGPSASGESGFEDGDLVRDLLVVEATVDDLDPRAWPSVLSGCLQEGALDAWLTPAIGKKGRPAQVLAALVEADAPGAQRLRAHIFASTGTLGVREYAVRRTALARAWRPVTVTLAADPTSATSASGASGASGAGIMRGVEGVVRIKLGLRGGRVVHATPEYEDCAALAARAGRPVLEALEVARAAAHEAGCRPGALASAP